MDLPAARTVVELIDAFQVAGWDRDIGSIIFTGAGKGFCLEAKSIKF